MTAWTKSRFEKDDLLACARGEMFGPGNAQLPAPPMLMFDRITEIASSQAAPTARATSRAELDIDPRAVVLRLPFPRRSGDAGLPRPRRHVAAGRLLPRLVGRPGRGRALGVGEVKFTGQVTPSVKRVTYRIDLKRVIIRKLVMGVGDGVMEADGNPSMRPATCGSAFSTPRTCA